LKLRLLRYKTLTQARSNKALRVNLPYRQSIQIGIIFTVEDRQKHDDVKEFVKRLEHEGKQVRVMSFLPKKKDNYEFMFDFFTEKDVNFWGNITSPAANRFAETPFDFVFYLDMTSNPHILNVLARSQAKCRVGRHIEGQEMFFEFMLQVNGNTHGLIDAVHKYTAKLR
jgi:hypothetical protein